MGAILNFEWLELCEKTNLYFIAEPGISGHFEAQNEISRLQSSLSAVSKCLTADISACICSLKTMSAALTVSVGKSPLLPSPQREVRLVQTCPGLDRSVACHAQYTQQDMKS